MSVLRDFTEVKGRIANATENNIYWTSWCT